jgi:hypothetical protein
VKRWLSSGSIEEIHFNEHEKGIQRTLSLGVKIQKILCTHGWGLAVSIFNDSEGWGLKKYVQVRNIARIL